MIPEFGKLIIDYVGNFRFKNRFNQQPQDWWREMLLRKHDRLPRFKFKLYRDQTLEPQIAINHKSTFVLTNQANEQPTITFHRIKILIKKKYA